MDNLPDATETHLKAGGLRILQPRRGYRFSVDALLVCDFVRLRRADRVLDLGAGCGVIALVLAARHPGVRITALELQRDMAGLAAENVRRNGLEGRIQVIEGDLNNIAGLMDAGVIDHVVTNPPYRSPFAGRLCGRPGEALARHEILTDLARLLSAARHALRPGGRISLVYPADLTVKLLSAMRGVNLEPKRMRMVHPGPGAQARLVLVEGSKDAGEELKVLPPLFLEEWQAVEKQTVC